MIVFRLDFDQNQFSQAKHWCRTNFGREKTINRKGRWLGTHIGPWEAISWRNSVFYFYDHIDAMAFKLMWDGE